MKRCVEGSALCDEWRLTEYRMTAQNQSRRLLRASRARRSSAVLFTGVRAIVERNANRMSQLGIRCQPCLLEPLLACYTFSEDAARSVAPNSTTGLQSSCDCTCGAGQCKKFGKCGEAH